MLVVDGGWNSNKVQNNVPAKTKFENIYRILCALLIDPETQSKQLLEMLLPRQDFTCPYSSSHISIVLPSKENLPSAKSEVATMGAPAGGGLPSTWALIAAACSFLYLQSRTPDDENKSKWTNTKDMDLIYVQASPFSDTMDHNNMPNMPRRQNSHEVEVGFAYIFALGTLLKFQKLRLHRRAVSSGAFFQETVLSLVAISPVPDIRGIPEILR
jgi:hypothetical protein